MYRRSITLLPKLLAVVVMGSACAAITDLEDVITPADVTRSALERASWSDNVSVSFVTETDEEGESRAFVRYQSDGLPSHERDAEYAVPQPGTRVPGAATAVAMADPSRAQNYDYLIPTDPVKADAPTPTSLGTIGVMISGAALFNPYEGDGVTVATSSNFSVLNDQGESVWFLDACNGHPTPMMGMYHYHALPPCVTAMVDEEGGPSHLIGIAFDGYPIYGNRDINGEELFTSDLDACGGITSPTPEFPGGIYHYVLLPTTDASSSIRCFSGVVTLDLGPGMMPPMPPPPPGA